MKYLVLAVVVALFSATITSSVKAQLTSDPMLNKMFAITDMTMTRMDPNNQQLMDHQWNPPQTPQAFLDLCSNQASQMNVYDVDRHCSAIGMDCGNKQLNQFECYTHLLYVGDDAPQEVVSSMNQKLEGYYAGIDSNYKATMCPSSDGTMGDHCNDPPVDLR